MAGVFTNIRDFLYRNLVASLSGRLLFFTTLFVLLAELVIYIPSAARHYHDLLSNKLANAQIAVLALDELSETALSPKLKNELLANAGVRLDWRIAADGNSPQLSSDQVLHTLRIVQEAFTNALKHSRPRCLSVHFENLPGGAWALAVGDDGEGFDPQALQGRGDGLRNMRSRAAQIPVALQIDSGAGGTVVRMVSSMNENPLQSS